MQLNLLNTLESMVRASFRTNQTLFRINSRVTQEFTEGYTAMLQSLIPAYAGFFTKPGAFTPPMQYSGELVNALLKSGLESAKTSTRSLNRARNEFDDLAIQSASELGKITNSLIPNRRNA